MKQSNLLDLQNASQAAHKKLQGADWLVRNARNQSGWMLIYERIDRDFIKSHGHDNFVSYLEGCREESEACKAALQQAIQEYKKNR